MSKVNVVFYDNKRCVLNYIDVHMDMVDALVDAIAGLKWADTVAFFAYGECIGVFNVQQIQQDIIHAWNNNELEEYLSGSVH